MNINLLRLNANLPILKSYQNDELSLGMEGSQINGNIPILESSQNDELSLGMEGSQINRNIPILESYQNPQLSLGMEGSQITGNIPILESYQNDELSLGMKRSEIKQSHSLNIRINSIYLIPFAITYYIFTHLRCSRLNLNLQLIFSILITAIFTTNPQIAKSQITPDNTLNQDISTLRNDTIKGIPSQVIEGGAIRGNNLFHSFTDFNVGANAGVYFNNPTNIHNILTRVTGINQSNILGTLGVLGNANLFLINPNGITFGANANLDIKGSFVASTSDRIIFNNYDFSATNPTAPPLLNINIPVGVGLRENPGNINLNNSILTIPSGKTLALIGGNINFDNAQILAPGSDIKLGGLTQTGIINFDENLNLVFPENVTRGNVNLTNFSQVNVSSDGGGSISINSQNLTMTGSSRLRAGIQSSSGLENSQAGDININNTEKITISDRFSLIDNIVGFSGTGNAGDINIITGSLEVTNNAYLDTSTNGTGNAGDINITALTGDIILENPGYTGNIYTGIYSNGTGAAGDLNINIHHGSLLVKNSSLRTENNQGRGNAGKLNLTVADSIILDFSDLLSYNPIESNIGDGGDINITANQLVMNNFSVIDARVSSIGDAGNIQINSNYLEMTEGSQIQASQFNTGNAGNININSQNINLDDAGILSRLNLNAIGSGGNIQIQTNSLNLNNAAQISVSTSGTGNSGSLNITANDRITMDNGSAFISRVNQSAIGNAGDINITTNHLEMFNAAQIQAISFGFGNGGNVNLKTETMKIDGLSSQIGTVISFSTLSNTFGRGNAGDINIETNSLEITNGGALVASSGGEGNGGSININSRDVVKFDGFASSAENLIGATGVGNTGDININTGVLEVTNNAFLQATISGKGNGGNININAREKVIFTGGLLTGASSEVGLTAEGEGGDININSKFVEISDFANLTTITLGKGNAGDININATEKIDIKSAGRVDASTLVGESQAGDITFNTKILNVTDNGSVESITNSAGKAGDIILNVVDSINMNNSNILANTTINSTGDGGNIIIDPIFVNLNNGSRIAVSSFGTGDAGNINFRAENLTINDSEFSAATFSGEGGNMILNIDNIMRLNNGDITTEAGGTGNGGNITLNTDFLQGRNNSQIIANAFEGNGGNINITTNSIFFTPDSIISANSQLGVDGIVDTNILAVDPTQGLIELPENIFDASKLIAENVCRQGTNSQFYQTGRGGLPVTPNQVFENNNIDVGLVKPARSSGVIASVAGKKETNEQEIKIARGLVVNKDGTVSLVGYDPSGMELQRQGNKQRVCK